jgi:predicted pyridoxine 5'-phosphate oxidase superfamily flavin-nucleotide-binding protein
VNGAACVTARADVLDRLTAVGKAPRTALIVAPEEVVAHCPEAFVRSPLREPESWPRADAPPSPAEVTLARVGDPDPTLAEVEQSQRESLIYRLE